MWLPERSRLRLRSNRDTIGRRAWRRFLGCSFGPRGAGFGRALATRVQSEPAPDRRWRPACRPGPALVCSRIGRPFMTPEAERGGHAKRQVRAHVESPRWQPPGIQAAGRGGCRPYRPSWPAAAGQITLFPHSRSSASLTLMLFGIGPAGMVVPTIGPRGLPSMYSITGASTFQPP